MVRPLKKLKVMDLSFSYCKFRLSLFTFFATTNQHYSSLPIPLSNPKLRHIDALKIEICGYWILRRRLYKKTSYSQCFWNSQRNHKRYKLQRTSNRFKRFNLWSLQLLLLKPIFPYCYIQCQFHFLDQTLLISYRSQTKT